MSLPAAAADLFAGVFKADHPELLCCRIIAECILPCDTSDMGRDHQNWELLAFLSSCGKA